MIETEDEVHLYRWRARAPWGIVAGPGSFEPVVDAGLNCAEFTGQPVLVEWYRNGKWSEYVTMEAEWVDVRSRN